LSSVMSRQPHRHDSGRYARYRDLSGENLAVAILWTT
jgi:hypothetical protein